MSSPLQLSSHELHLNELLNALTGRTLQEAESHGRPCRGPVWMTLQFSRFGRDGRRVLASSGGGPGPKRKAWCRAQSGLGGDGSELEGGQESKNWPYGSRT